MSATPNPTSLIESLERIINLTDGSPVNAERRERINDLARGAMGQFEREMAEEFSRGHRIGYEKPRLVSVSLHERAMATLERIAHAENDPAWDGQAIIAEARAILKEAGR